MHRKGKNFNLQYLINNLEFTDVRKFLQFGRIPKIGSSIEISILTKISRFPSVESFIDDNGMPIYYRTSGGRYFKVVTNYPTGSTKEKSILLNSKLRNAIGCLLSSNLGFWYYQIYSNNLDWKYCEITSFPIPPIDNIALDRLNSLYSEYLTDIERNANVRFNSKIKASSVTRDFINKLLKKSPKERIGQNEFSQITTHHFFQSTNVNAIVNQKFTPPLMPNITEDALENFEAIFTNQEIEDFEESTNPEEIDNINDIFEEMKK
jgi:hypothetical protein